MTPAIVDTSLTVIEMATAGILLGLAASSSSCEGSGCMLGGYGQGVIGLSLLGIGIFQGAAAITGWVRYQLCLEPPAPAHASLGVWPTGS